MLCAIGKLQERQVGQVVKQVRDFEVLQLRNLERENFIAHSVKVSEELLRIFGFQIFKQVLNVNFNVSLLVTVSVLLFLYVLHSGITFALLLPVKFLRNVSSRDGYGQI